MKLQQQDMLAIYLAEAHHNGNPTILPIFCNSCNRPFTYPVGAIAIKCPLCFTTNEIHPPSNPQTQSV